MKTKIKYVVSFLFFFIVISCNHKKFPLNGTLVSTDNFKILWQKASDKLPENVAKIIYLEVSSFRNTCFGECPLGQPLVVSIDMIFKNNIINLSKYNITNIWVRYGNTVWQPESLKTKVINPPELRKKVDARTGPLWPIFSHIDIIIEIQTLYQRFYIKKKQIEILKG
ncbi:hypothetical protein KKF34_05160 [Myxococcota bacterium]|nr:hypothetical protein [Myxococcota bacterium]MBU1380908.1 hypothetical protein [Myxococcota bacterium]MBU1496249.1 hypothetical protein [Myxococcota bacterium]